MVELEGLHSGWRGTELDLVLRLGLDEGRYVAWREVEVVGITSLGGRRKLLEWREAGGGELGMYR